MKRNKLLTLLIGVCLVLALVAVPFMSACAPEVVEEEEEEEEVEEVKWVTIGHCQPLSGPVSFWGVAHEQGILIAIDEINEAGGFLVNGQRYMLELESFDNRYDAKLTVAGITALVEMGIKLIIGPLVPAGVIAAAPIAWENGALMIAAQSSVAIKNANLPNYFEAETNEERGSYFADYIVDGLGVDTMGSSMDDIALCREVEDCFFPAFEAKGGEVVINELFDPSTEDFYTIIAKIREADPDIVLMHGAAPCSALFLKQRMELNYPVQCISLGNVGAAGASAFRVAGAAGAEGHIETARFFDPEHEWADWEIDIMGVNMALLDKFTQASLEKYGPDWYTSAQCMGYSFTYVLVDVMQRAGTVTDGEALVAAMETLNLSTAWTTIRFAPGCHNFMTSRIWSQFHVVDEITGEFIMEPIGGSKSLDAYGREWETYIHKELNIDDIRAGIVPGTAAYGIGY